MPTERFVTLSEALRVAKQPLKEPALWALLHLTSSAVQASLNSGETGPGLLITPDSVLLYPEGRLEVLSGVHDEAKSKFTAPEVDYDNRVEEKMYVYSIGATLSVALESTVGSHLYQLLAAMMSSEPSKRPSLQSVVDTASAQQSAQGAAREIYTLVTFVLDAEQHASSGDEGDDNEESLEAELKAVMNSESHDCISNGGLANQDFQANSQPLERSISSQSIDGASSVGGLSTSSLPLTYYSSVQEGLDKEAGQSRDTPSHSLCNPLSLSLQFQDIGVLASSSRGQLPQGSFVLQNQQKTASLPACTTGPSTTSGDFDKQQMEEDVDHPVDTSYSLLQFQSDAYLDDLPSLPPPPIPTLSQDEPQPLGGSLTNTPTALDRIDSLLQHGTTNRLASEATASFDYSDLDSSHHNQPQSRYSSGEEFEFCQPLPSEESEVGNITALTGHASETQISRANWESDTHRALDEALEHLDNNHWEQTTDEEDRDPSHLYAKVDKKRGRKELDKDDVSALYATIDKSKKTGQAMQTEREGTNHAPHLESESDNERLSLRPPLPLPQDNTTSISQRPSSGIYEEVESLRAQVAVVDTSGYTEVGGRRAEPGYEVGYSGTGSLHKLCNMLGPEFSTMTGKGTKVADVAGSLPEGRSNVEVVMLNGKAVKFTVAISATVSELFEQVVSYQSLKETHIFGLAVRKDRDDIFLDTTSKLVKHAPPHWAQSTHHTSFTVFFRVKHYVENVSHLVQPLTQHLYYLQLRKDLIEGLMFCHDDPALGLAALALQAEKGDCIDNRTTYFRMEDYVPARVIDKLGRRCLRDLLPSMHKERRGLSQLEAELEFLKEVQKIPEYGMLFYRVAKKKNGEIGSVWLGFCVRGLVVFDVHRGVKTATQHCAWRKTSNISFAHRKFVINLHDHPEPLVFYTKNYKRARYLLEFSKACHKFHLVWAKKTLGTSSSTTSTTGPGTTKIHTLPVEAIVEYPSISRPSSVVEEMASTYRTPSSSPYHHPQVKMETVSVILNRGEADGFGFSIAGSSHHKEVYVVKVAANGASNGRLLNGDRIVAINAQSVESYSQTRALLKRCGTQLTIDIQRKTSQSTDQEILPPGRCIHVEVSKEGGAIGVRIAGGTDKPHSRGLVYIKCLTANTAASRSGALQEGDIVLQVNGVSLKGMTHRQAANTVVGTGDNVSLQLLRPSDPYWWKTSTDHSLSEVAEKTLTFSSSLPPSPLLETLSPVPPLSPPSPEPNAYEHSSSLPFAEEQ